MTFRNSVRLSEPINLKFMFPFICKLNWLYSSKTFGNCMELMHSTCFYVFKSKCENTILGVTISNWHLWEYTTINGLKLNFMFQCKLIASLAIQQLPEWKIFVGNEIERFLYLQELVETDIMLCDGLRFPQFLSRFIELKRTWFEWLKCFWSKWFINLYWQDWAWNENILIPRRNDNQSLKSLNDKYRVDRFSYFI